MLHGLTMMGLSMVGQVDLPEWLASMWYVALVLFGFTIVIFFHELGHYLAAKWADVRVERFAIGFGRELFGFTAGETRYSFNILPFGGYVKMLGQEDFAVDKTGEIKVRHDPRSFISKTIGQRMVIVSAGVIMNLVFAAVAFAVVTMIGRDVLPAIVGTVVPDSAAGRAGIQSGDRIFAVNDREIRDFEDLMMAVVLADTNEELELSVLRNSQMVLPPPRVMPEYKTDVKVRQIGISAAMNLRVAMSLANLSTHTRDDALQANDLLVKIGSDSDARPIQHISDVWAALMMARGKPVELVVKRPTGTVTLNDLTSADADIPSKEVVVHARALWQLMPADQDDVDSSSLLGLVPRLMIETVAPNSAGELGGLRTGDVVVRAATIDHPTVSEFRGLVEHYGERDMRLIVRRPNEANKGFDAGILSTLTAHREELLDAARADPSAARDLLASLLRRDGAAPANLRSVETHAAGLRTAAEWHHWLDQIDLHELVVRPKRAKSLLKPPGKPTLGVTFPWHEDEAVVVADVRETLRGRPTPAALAGLPRGAVIVRVDDQPIYRWMELTEALRQRAGSTVSLTYRLGGDVRQTEFVVPASVSTLIDLPPGANIISIAGATNAELSRPDGATRVASLPDWRVVTALLSRHVGESVTIRYRTRDGQTHEAAMQVDENNVDPWLLRVAYQPSFLCYPLRDFVSEPNPIRALVLGTQRAYRTTIYTYLTIKHIIFTREVGVENIAGPVGIVRRGSQIAEGGFTNLLWFLGILSANLAVINFLPLPIVDGGLFIFLLLEKIRGEPVSIRTQVVTQLIGIALIVTVFLFVTFQDIINWNR
jgi:RIP metalloprotease RseP